MEGKLFKVARVFPTIFAVSRRAFADYIRRSGREYLNPTQKKTTEQRYYSKPSQEPSQSAVKLLDIALRTGTR